MRELAADYKRDRLDGSYVDRVARTAAAMLREGCAVAIPYEPKNGTRYELVLTPLSHTFENPSHLPVAADCARHDCVAVAIVNEPRVAIVLPILAPGFAVHPSYLQDKLRISGGDALALLALFQEISDA